MSDSDSTLRRRLRFRSWHRGTKEMDFLLGRFADARLEDLRGSELHAYDALLQEPDPDLYNWITGPDLPKDTTLASVVQLIRHHHRTG